MIVFLLFVTTIHCRNLPEDRQSRHLWHNIVDKLTDKFDVDNRHFDKEAIFLFPDVGFQSLDNNDTWKLMVHGWKYQSNKRENWLTFSTSSWLERLAKNLVNQNDVLYLNGSINRDRLRPFFVSDGSNEEITIQIGDKNQLVRTNNSGEFYEQTEVTNDVIEQQRKGDLMTYEAIYDDEGKATGMIRLIGDIDDTIKISEVLDKVRLLANIFIFPSKTVSSTRDRLYTLTQEFINTNHFPDGSFHMRHFDWAITFLFDFLHCQSTFIHKMSYLRFFLSCEYQT